MDISAFKNEVDVGITNQTQPDTIPPTVVGKIIKDLADLLNDYIESVQESVPGSYVFSNGLRTVGNQIKLGLNPVAPFTNGAITEPMTLIMGNPVTAESDKFQFRIQNGLVIMSSSTGVETVIASTSSKSSDGVAESKSFSQNSSSGTSEITAHTDDLITYCLLECLDVVAGGTSSVSINAGDNTNHPDKKIGIIVKDLINNKGMEDDDDYSANKTEFSYATVKMLADALTGYAPVSGSNNYIQNKNSNPTDIQAGASINIDGKVKGYGSIIATPLTGPVLPDPNAIYEFKNSRTRSGRLGMFQTSSALGSDIERWFFGSSGSMVFLPGGATGGSHSGGILLGDRDAASVKTFGFYTKGGLGRIAFNSDPIYNFTVITDLMTYDETGIFKLPLTTSKFIIGSSNNNGAELQVFHTPADALPGLTLDGNQIVGGKHISFQQYGIEWGYIDNNARWFGAGVSNYSNISNASLNMTINGIVATRNVADTNRAFTVRQVNPGSTGDLLDLQFVNIAGSKFKVDYRGIIGLNGTLLTAGQSFRVNAAGTLMEPFVAAEDSTVVHRTGVESISGSKTFTSSVAVNSSLNATTFAVSGTSNLAGGATCPVVPVGASDLTNKQYVDGLDGMTVHKIGSESISGLKTFTTGIQVANNLTLTYPTPATNAMSFLVLSFPGVNAGNIRLYNTDPTTQATLATMDLCANPLATGTRRNYMPINTGVLLNDTGDQAVTGTVTGTNMYSTSAAPIVTLGGATTVGVGATISIVGNNQDGEITLTTGIGTGTPGAAFSFSMSGGFAYPTRCAPVINPSLTGVGTANTALLVINSASPTGFQTLSGYIAGAAGLIDSHVYKWTYHNGGY